MVKDVSKVTVWDLDSGEKRTEMNYANFITAVVFVPELHAIISGDGNFMKDQHTGQVVVWNIDSLEQHQKLKTSAVVCSVAFLSEQRAILSCDRSNSLIFWDANSGEKRILVKFDTLPWCLALAPEMQAIIV